MKITIEAYGHKTAIEFDEVRLFSAASSENAAGRIREIIVTTFDKFIELVIKSMGVPDGNVLKEDIDPT